MDDLDIDDLLNGKPKKLNAKKKGNRVELEISKVLSNHFKEPFSRSVGSGNRFSQVSNLPSHAKSTLLGDICPPENFKWCIECKGGYDNINLNDIFEKCIPLDKFISQSLKDSISSGRLPIIIWKRNRKPLVAILQAPDLINHHLYCNKIYYKGWIIVPLSEMFKNCGLDFWFYRDASTVRNRDKE